MNITPLDLNYSYPSEGVGVLVIKDNDTVVNKLHFQTSIKTEPSDLGEALHQVSNTAQKRSSEYHVRPHQQATDWT